MANIVKTAQQVNSIISKYNQACTDFNDARTMSDAGKAALAATRVIESLIEMSGLNVPLSADPAEIIKQVDKLRNENRLIQNGITEPEVYKSLGLPVPKFDDKGGTCPIIGLPVKSAWDAAENWVRRSDPLTLDLDGDGLETTGTGVLNPIYFDQDGDGIKTSTGWVKSDDGFLVLDKDSNGTIDNGRELFGDSTIKSNGQTATDGFDALADIDSNADGKVDANDSQFANLRIWRDLNQDGISQTAELYTLASQNIIGINVAKTANSQTLPNGNQIADKGTFIKANGSTGELDAVTGNLADINLAEDTFYRQFPDELDTTSVATLPDMQGSGKVRDLREAATQSTTLQTLLTNYSSATTRTAQLAQIDALLDAWADTSGMAESMSVRVANMTGYTKADGTVIPYTFTSNLSAEWQQKLHIIETFNGAYFFGLPGTTQTQGAITGLTIATPNASSTSVQITVNLNQQQLDLLQQSYDAIKTSVYDAIALQTRFKTLFDQINLVIDTNGINFDFTQVYATFDAKVTANAVDGIVDLIEFNNITKDILIGAGWQGFNLVDTYARNLSPELQGAIGLYDVIYVGQANVYGDVKNEYFIADNSANNIYAADGDDFLNGGGGSDILYGGNGRDILLGQDGSDTIDGGAGDDVIDGGIGNDYLSGKSGNDIYQFGLGSGQDTIDNYSEQARITENPDNDRIELGVGITEASVILTHTASNDLQINILDAADQLTIRDYFSWNMSSNYTLKEIVFSNGAVWNIETVKAKLLETSAGSDNVIGYDTSDDNISGGDGNDSIKGEAGNDVLDGDAGSDTLYGGSGDDSLNGGSESDVLYGATGNDALDGGAGNDILDGGSGDDVLLGGAEEDTLLGNIGNDILDGGIGNDVLNGGAGTNTYLFGLGSGHDVIANNDTSTSRVDNLYLGASVLTTDVTLVRRANDLEVRINNSTDKITITNHFTTSPITMIFQDGTQWDQIGIDFRLDFSPAITADNDFIYGSNGANNIDGLSGSDTIYGYGGGDNLIGGDGQDYLDGGIGNDSLIGGIGLDSIYGGDGNDTLNGGAHNDLLSGGAGDDNYTFGLGYGVDTIYETSEMGLNVDKVLFDASIAPSNIAYYKSGNDLTFRLNDFDYLIINNFFSTSDSQYKVEQFVFTNGTIWTSQQIQAFLTTPTPDNDRISGYDFADNFDGLAGNDQIDGNGGIDTLLGGQGYDTLNGGLGDDYLEGGTENDSLRGDDGNDTFFYNSGDGVDTITDTLGNDVLKFGAGISPGEISLYRNLTTLYIYRAGTEKIITITSNSNSVNPIEQFQFDNGVIWDAPTILSHTIYGAANTFTGTSGNDGYTVDNNYDVINEATNQGTDSVASSVTYGLGANIENLTLTGFLDIDAKGNLLDNVLTGNQFDNFLDGGGYFLSQGDGIDTLIGGAGNDTYYVTSEDVVQEVVGGGIDTAFANFSYTLAENVENLTIVGNYQYSITATGNSLDNVIRVRTNQYGDIIDGGAGADTMIGGPGDNIFYVDNIGDKVYGSRNFTVYSSTDFVLQPHFDGIYFSQYVEKVILTGDSATNATGNAGNNTLDGRYNSAANILEGGAGDDTYLAGENDIIIEEANGGNDTFTVYAYGAGLFKLSANMENLIVSTQNSLAADLEGSEDDNRLTGNNGYNIIRGLGGNDIIYGGTNGGDTLDGGDGNDVVSGNGWLYGGSGDDKLTSSLWSVLNGGQGNDLLAGYGLNTTYTFARGDGQDIVTESSSYYFNGLPYDSVDTIELLGDTFPNEINLSRVGDDLLIRNIITDDLITAKNHFIPDSLDTNYRIEQIKFADGSIWDAMAIENKIARNNSNVASAFADVLSGTLYNDTINGLDGNDSISGGYGDDSLDGGVGDDYLYGGIGTDVLIGGAGNDNLQGGLGADTYKFGRGSGQDLIVDGKNNAEIDSILMDVDIDPTQVVVRATGQYDLDLTLSIVGDSAQITIHNFYVGTPVSDSGGAKQVVFADGTVWDAIQLKDLATSYVGTSSNDVITSSEGNDRVYGLAGDDTLYGLGGDDLLDGGAGSDTLVGGYGNDTYVLDNLSDVVVEEDDGYIDTVESTISYTLGAFVENLTLAGSDNINATGNSLSNILTGNIGNNQLDGGAGIDEMAGGIGDDLYLVGSGSDVVTENEGEGLDSVQSTVTFTLSSNVENLTLTGTSAINGTGNAENNILIGNGAANRLTGADGHDTLEGGAGNDTMIGGLGDDTYIIDVSTDVITEATNAGTDTVISAITYTLGSTSNLENLYLTGTANVNATGNGLNNEISGNSGNNVITAGAGNDTLEGGLGIDTLVGGLGSDDYYYYLGDGNDQIDNTATDNATAVDTLYMFDIMPADVVLSRVVSDLIITINASATVTVKNYFIAGDSKIDQIIFGDETVWNQADIQLLVPSVPTTGDDTLTGTSADDIIDALAGNDTVSGGDGNDQLLGNTGNDSLNGGNGNDILNGGTGTDSMIGGLGDDTYTVDVSTDVVTEAASAGTDAVNVAITTVSGTYTLGANVENGTLANTVAFTLTGNILGNVLTGNTAANTLNGGDGNDTLNGLAGSDTMVGGLGNDTYVIDATGDVVTEAASAGTDTVNVAITTAGGTYTVATNVENATLTNTVAYNLTGNALNNVLLGNSAANVLNGGAGIDTLMGGAGNDTYTIDVTTDVITENINEGTDLVNVAATSAGSTYTVAANVENATLTNTVAFTLTGNALNNVLTGNAAANTLNGGDGNDTLNGLAGNDTMLGGLGDDAYTVDATGDVITENLNQGTDLVNVAIATASGTYTVAANVENATLTNTVAFTLIGNVLDNVLTGNAAANTLNGGDGNDTLNGLAGNDTMVGGLGNDTYTIDATGDVLTEAASAGSDTVNVAIATASGTYTVAANVENAFLTNTVAYNLTGNALANFLKGNAANNTLSDTAGGNDILQGLAGVDTFNDTVGNNLFDGGIDNDVMTGGTGREIFIGGQGNDTITTGTGFDVISFNKGDGQDSINASTGADNTLSLGGNFAYSDLSLTKSTNNLILKIGATDQITFTNWYASSPTNKSVVNLQVIAEAIQGFTLGGADTLRDNKVENFNFANLVAAFDAAGATANWQLTDARLTAHLQAGSDSAAIGGDPAYQYGKNSNLMGMGLINAQSVINNASFGQSAQALNNPSVWQAEVLKLA